MPAACLSCLVSYPTLRHCLTLLLSKPCEGSTCDFSFPCILVLSTIPEQRRYWISICWPVCSLVCTFPALAGIALGEEGWAPGRVRSQGYCLEGDVSRRFGLGHRTVLTTILVLSITLFFLNKKSNSSSYLLKRNVLLDKKLKCNKYWRVVVKKKRCLDKCWSLHMASAYVKYPWFNVYGGGDEAEGEMYGESNMEIYNTICKIDSQWEFAVWLRTQTGALRQSGRVGWGGRFGREGTRVYL